MATTNIEKRLTSIERELSRLKNGHALAQTPTPIQSLESIHGAFENDEAFQETRRLGRQWRVQQRHQADKAKKKRR
jgi:hypothetical protein